MRLAVVVLTLVFLGLLLMVPLHCTLGELTSNDPEYDRLCREFMAAVLALEVAKSSGVPDIGVDRLQSRCHDLLESRRDVVKAQLCGNDLGDRSWDAPQAH